MNKLFHDLILTLAGLLLLPSLALSANNGFNDIPVPVTMNQTKTATTADDAPNTQSDTSDSETPINFLSVEKFSTVAPKCPANTATNIGNITFELQGTNNNLCHLVLTITAENKQYLVDCYVPMVDMITTNLFNMSDNQSEADDDESEGTMYNGIGPIMKYCNQSNPGTEFNANQSKYGSDDTQKQ